MKRPVKIFLLPYKDKKLLCASFVLVVFTRISLWIIPYDSLNRFLLKFCPDFADGKTNDWALIEKVTAYVKACSRFVPKATCLTQALTVRTLLGLKEQNSHLKIGVKRDSDGKFLAHAWIEIEGKIVIGKLPHHKQFVVMNRVRPVVL